LLYVGRLGIEKKLNRLRKVLDANPTARLAFVGGGPAEESLKEYFKGYPVTFLGSLSGEPLSQAFASADIFVMPSDSETLGFVVLEAMASGLPVVAVNAGGLPDIVEDNLNGALVENDDNAEEFSARIQDWISDKEKRIKLGQQARKWAEKWSWELATSELRNIHYRQAIKNFRNKYPAKEEQAPLPEYSYYRPDLAF
jgi:sulfoquinovosyltransferase